MNRRYRSQLSDGKLEAGSPGTSSAGLRGNGQRVAGPLFGGMIPEEFF